MTIFSSLLLLEENLTPNYEKSHFYHSDRFLISIIRTAVPDLPSVIYSRFLIHFYALIRGHFCSLESISSLPSLRFVYSANERHRKNFPLANKPNPDFLS